MLHSVLLLLCRKQLENMVQTDRLKITADDEGIFEGAGYQQPPDSTSDRPDVFFSPLFTF